ncbi:hypothetical protein NCAS_0B07210 [Naumovozyma castellii]|uniref:Uncharacterized protein n=1 Tax=Naumovozyma castellii TaxID=27288 RepID=G0VA75_NAUCA|nr:hypothetical protein NCAS_0B07210 [Naumovozyma castellii CBS 4309]CCC68805.1 hypothetical protein NCAS_0B07210 [Naumovozyma castellii CBS 4309]
MGSRIQDPNSIKHYIPHMQANTTTQNTHTFRNPFHNGDTRQTTLRDEATPRTMPTLEPTPQQKKRHMSLPVSLFRHMRRFSPATHHSTVSFSKPVDESIFSLYNNYQEEKYRNIKPSIFLKKKLSETENEIEKERQMREFSERYWLMENELNESLFESSSDEEEEDEDWDFEVSDDECISYCEI